MTLRDLLSLALPADTPVVAIDSIGAVRHLRVVDPRRLDPRQVDIDDIPPAAVVLIDTKDRFSLRP